MALVIGILAVAAGPLFSQPQHPACRAMQHHCGSDATIAHCCCGDGAAPNDTGTQAHSRIEPARGASTVAMLPKCAQGPSTTAPAIAVQTSPPRACFIDLPTLFTALLI